MNISNWDRKSFVIIYTCNNNLTTSQRFNDKSYLKQFFINFNKIIIKLKIINYRWGLLPRELNLLTNLKSFKLHECSCVFPSVSSLINLEKITMDHVTVRDRVTNLKSINKLKKLKEITINTLDIDLVNLPNIIFDLIINNLNCPLTNLPILNKLIVSSSIPELKEQIKIPYGCQFIFNHSL